jgi:hypothetical protein
MAAKRPASIAFNLGTLPENRNQNKNQNKNNNNTESLGTESLGTEPLGEMSNEFVPSAAASQNHTHTEVQSQHNPNVSRVKFKNKTEQRNIQRRADKGTVRANSLNLRNLQSATKRHKPAQSILSKTPVMFKRHSRISNQYTPRRNPTKRAPFLESPWVSGQNLSKAREKALIARQHANAIYQNINENINNPPLESTVTVALPQAAAMPVVPEASVEMPLFNPAMGFTMGKNTAKPLGRGTLKRGTSVRQNAGKRRTHHKKHGTRRNHHKKHRTHRKRHARRN